MCVANATHSDSPCATAMKITAKKIVLLALLLAMAALLIFTTMRHEPKRTALSHAARERIEALDDALKNGLISRVEHDKRVAEIVQDDSAADDKSGPPEGNPLPQTNAPAPAR
jgi:hypothetical protein